MPHRRSAALAVPFVLLLLTACTAAPPAASPASAPTAAGTPQPTPASSPTSIATARLAEPTCENIMSASFTTTWLPTEVEAADPLFADGITCRWQADPAVGTDNVLIFSWTPAAQSEWDALVAEFLAVEDGGWIVESGPRGHYLTGKTDYWVQDDAGYGATYLFTGHAVIYAMTKAETDDVAGPPPADG